MNRLTALSRSLLTLGALAFALALPWGALFGDRATTEQLGGAGRVLAHIATDKPIYKPGETFYARATLLEAAGTKPLAFDKTVNAVFRVKGPKGDVAASGWVQGSDSVLGLSWAIPKELAGGKYTLSLEFPHEGWAPAERVFEIRAYRAPRINSQIEFTRKGYGPGELAQATLKAERAEGGYPAGAKVGVTARIDGALVHTGTAEIDAAGRCVVEFRLPEKIAEGEGSLALAIEDGGVVEVAAKTIPILLQSVDVAFYPEGGDLVIGLPCRVYVEAKTPSKRPADIAGRILDEAGSAVGSLRTDHEGRGTCAFTPKAGATYSLAIDEPAGIAKRIALPGAKPAGATIAARAGAVESAEPIDFEVAATEAGTYKLTLARREVVIGEKTLELGASTPASASFAADAANGGVLVATLWSATGKPLAERLVFRRPAESLKISLTTKRLRAVPGEAIEVEVATTDAAGKPVGAVVGLVATDERTLELIETREQAPRLPAMALLEGEVTELADAKVYLDPANPDAPRQLDLLLGTQGWRRFAFVDAPEFVKRSGNAARRVLALAEPHIWAERHRRLEARGHLMPQPPGAAVNKADAPEEDAAPAAPAEPNVDAPPADPPAADMPAAKMPEQARQQQAGQGLHGGRSAEPMGEDGEKKLADLDAKEKNIAGEGVHVVVGKDFVAVREYAHVARAGRQPGERADFAETLCFHAGVKTDPATGKATIKFALSDSITRFRVMGDGFTATGALGSGDLVVESVEPFYVEPKLPLEVTAGDVIELPIALVNGTLEGLTATVEIACASNALAIAPVGPVALEAGGRVRALARIAVGATAGEIPLTVKANAGPWSDQVALVLKVVPRGFPTQVARGGMIEPGKSVSFEVEVPADVVAGSLSSTAAIYPSPLAQLTSALESLIREPCGCFEQTSSSTYPLVMAQQYFKSHQGVDPKLIARSDAILETGYKRLIGFECKQGGYEWFGADPGHEALSAYGLLEFSDMAKVRSVDAAMVARTHAWLLAQRDGKGGFSRKTHTYHEWSSEPECVTAYCLWALLESGDAAAVAATCKVELAHLDDLIAGSKNSYVLALAANTMALAGKAKIHAALCAKLASAQDAKSGLVKGATTSMCGSGGEALEIETTALAVLAWLKSPEHMGNATRGVQALAESCKGGRYGSTQSTVLALRAIVAYDKATAGPKAPGEVVVTVDGTVVGTVKFGADAKESIALPSLADRFAPGKHVVSLAMTGGSGMPCALTLDFHRERPSSSAACALEAVVELSAGKVVEGELVDAIVVVKNTTDKALATPIAIVGVPGGAEPRHEQLAELVKAGKIAAYEVRGREVVLYWRFLAPKAEVSIPLSCVAAVPGTYAAPASRAYQYYTDEHKCWVAGAGLVITAR